MLDMLGSFYYTYSNLKFDVLKEFRRSYFKEFIMATLFCRLSKDGIWRLPGGPKYGAMVLLELNAGREGADWLYGRVRNQCRSQRTKKNPEGYIPIRVKGLARELIYDIASGTTERPVFGVGPTGRLSVTYELVPASLYRFYAQSEEAAVRRIEARRLQARWALLLTIEDKYWADAREVAKQMAKELRIGWLEDTGEPLAARIIRLAYALDAEKCQNLTALLLAAPGRFAPAA